MRKIFFLFAGALVSFFLLSYIDEYENLIQPFFSKPERPLAISQAGVKEDIKATIRDFNDNISDAFRLSDPSLLSKGQIDDKLRISIAEEIHYLLKEGKVMDMKVNDIKIGKITPISPRQVQVSTREVIGLRYLDTKGSVSSVYQEAEYTMAYTLEKVKDAWKVVLFETAGVSGPGQ